MNNDIEYVSIRKNKLEQLDRIIEFTFDKCDNINRCYHAGDEEENCCPIFDYCGKVLCYTCGETLRRWLEDSET